MIKMNKLYILITICLSYFINAQLSMQEQNAKRMKQENSLYSELMMESQQIDLKKINKIVLNSINRDSLTKPNLVFIIEPLDPTPLDYLDVMEQVSSRIKNPYFNQAIFWNKKNIKFLTRKLKKNLIPYKSKNGFFTFGYFTKENKRLIKINDEGYIKNHILEQKEGKIMTIKDNTILEEKIMYFPYGSQSLLLKQNGDYTNFDRIRIGFENHFNKIIVFEISYNYNPRKERFVYQYINNKWKRKTEL